LRLQSNILNLCPLVTLEQKVAILVHVNAALAIRGPVQLLPVYANHIDRRPA